MTDDDCEGRMGSHPVNTLFASRELSVSSPVLLELVQWMIRMSCPSQERQELKTFLSQHSLNYIFRKVKTNWEELRVNMQECYCNFFLMTPVRLVSKRKQRNQKKAKTWDKIKRLCWTHKEAIQQREYGVATGLIRPLFTHSCLSFTGVDAVIERSPN